MCINVNKIISCLILLSLYDLICLLLVLKEWPYVGVKAFHSNLPQLLVCFSNLRDRPSSPHYFKGFPIDEDIPRPVNVSKVRI